MGSNAPDGPVTPNSPVARASRTRRTARTLVLVAAAAGLVHAGFSAYWALGGTWLLSTIGAIAVEFANRAPLESGLMLGAVAVAKALAALIPVARHLRGGSQPRLDHELLAGHDVARRRRHGRPGVPRSCPRARRRLRATPLRRRGPRDARPRLPLLALRVEKDGRRALAHRRHQGGGAPHDALPRARRNPAGLG